MTNEELYDAFQRIVRIGETGTDKSAHLDIKICWLIARDARDAIVKDFTNGVERK